MLQDKPQTIKLNLGCGQNKIKGCINVDVEQAVKPDVVADFRSLLPFPDSSVDCIYMFHVMEHIEERFQHCILAQMWRVLKPDAVVYISYPEFVKIAQNYINNYKGQRKFWKATIYGRQLYKADYHVALMDSQEFKKKLQQAGFKDVVVKPEAKEDYNTVVRCVKGNKVPTYEELVIDKVFTSPSLR